MSVAVYASTADGPITMGYVAFVSCLFEDGRVTVPEVAALPEEELRAGDELLAEYEVAHRLAMPAEAPQFVASAVRLAAIKFFRACQFAVYRDVGVEMLNQELGRPFTDPVSPGHHYSVDLVFRNLPELTKFAASAAERDPLLEHLYRWARQWPLSSVGMTGIADVSIDGFAESPSLMQLYVDRVMATGDESRLSDIRVREAVQTALGMFPNLDERLGMAMKKYDAVKINS